MSRYLFLTLIGIIVFELLAEQRRIVVFLVATEA